jgi:MFS family permease
MNTLLEKTKAVYNEYPRAFWIFALTVFIDRLGCALLYPFYALYLTQKFNIGMTDVGKLFALFSLSGFIGSALGGAMTDRMGRRGVLIFSLIASSASAVLLGLANSIAMFAFLSITVGIMASVGHPAHNAIVADVLPPEKRAQGYGIIRVIFNLSVVIGPVIGGFLASQNYLLIFIADAIISLICAVIIFAAMPETKPEAHPNAKPETVAQTFGGYGKVFRDAAFMAFMFVTTLQVIVYMNMNTTLGVFLRDEHSIPTSGYGWILSLNAAMVVLFQIWLTRRMEGYKPMIMMALGSAFYAVGFAMYGFTSTYFMFIIAMVIITIGEMIVSPVAQSIVADFAPEEMRGRYMAVSGFSWAIPFAVGPYLAGLIMDGPRPYMLWYAAGFVGLLSTLAFLALYRMRVKQEEKPSAIPEIATL